MEQDLKVTETKPEEDWVFVQIPPQKMKIYLAEGKEKNTTPAEETEKEDD